MWNNQKQLKVVLPNLQIFCHFKLDFQKLDQHTGLIRGG